MSSLRDFRIKRYKKRHWEFFKYVFRISKKIDNGLDIFI